MLRSMISTQLKRLINGNVAQASSQWKKLVKKIKRSTVKKVRLSAFLSLKRQHLRRAASWLLLISVVAAMLLWNWQLLLATSAGILVMLLVYLMQDWDLQDYWSALRRLLHSSNHSLTVAAGSGGVAALSTYMAVSIWIDSDSHWIAAGAILQGVGTLLTLILLAWQIVSRQISREETKLSRLLSDLTEVDPLKRLIAVRQLMQLRVERNQRREISDCLRLMLSQEQETVVRDAVLDALQVLEDTQTLSKGAPVLQTPLNLKRSPVTVRPPA